LCQSVLSTTSRTSLSFCPIVKMSSGRCGTMLAPWESHAGAHDRLLVFSDTSQKYPSQSNHYASSTVRGAPTFQEGVQYANPVVGHGYSGVRDGNSLFIQLKTLSTSMAWHTIPRTKEQVLQIDFGIRDDLLGSPR
jgi:hypothetical protein